MKRHTRPLDALANIYTSQNKRCPQFIQVLWGEAVCHSVMGQTFELNLVEWCSINLDLCLS